MEKSKKENKILTVIAICLIILIVILTILFQVLLPNIKEKPDTENDNFVSNNELTEESMYKPSQNEWMTLQLSGEESRIKYYVGTFISTYIGDEKYEMAYDLLSDGFKANYFETYEKFESYAKEKYPTSLSLNYGEIQREGELYIIDVTVEDFFNEKATFTQTFVIKENNFNDYELAFSV